MLFRPTINDVTLLLLRRFSIAQTRHRFYEMPERKSVVAEPAFTVVSAFPATVSDRARQVQALILKIGLLYDGSSVAGTARDGESGNVRPADPSFAVVSASPVIGLGRARQVHALILKTGLIYGDEGLVGAAPDGDYDAMAAIFPESGSHGHADPAFASMFASPETRLGQARHLFDKMPKRKSIITDPAFAVVSASPETGLSRARQVHALILKIGLIYGDEGLVGTAPDGDYDAVAAIFPESGSQGHAEPAFASMFASPETRLCQARHLFDEMPKRKSIITDPAFAVVSASPETGLGRARQVDALILKIGLIYGDEGLVGTAPDGDYDAMAAIFPESGSHGHAEPTFASFFASPETRLGQDRHLFDEMPKRKSIITEPAFAIVSASPETGLSRFRQVQALILKIGLLCSGGGLAGTAPNGDRAMVAEAFLNPGNRQPAAPAFSGIFASPGTGPGRAHQVHALTLKIGLLYDCGTVAGTVTNSNLGVPAVVSREPDGHRHVAAWNSMIGSLAKSGNRGEAIRLFSDLRRSATELSEASILAVLAAWSPEVAPIHALVVKLGMGSFNCVGNSLLSWYFDAGTDGLGMAEKVFDEMPERDAATWNSMIAGLRKIGEPGRALRFVSWMNSVDGLLPNGRTLASALRAAVDVAMSPVGEMIHGKAVVLGLVFDEFVGCSLVNFYSRLGKMKLAWRFFDEMPVRRAPAWNALIGGLSGRWIGAVREMIRSGFGAGPNEFSFSSALRSSSSMTDLIQLHCLALKLGFDRHGRVASAAVSAYSAADPSFDPTPFLPPASEAVPVEVANAVGGIWNRQGHFKRTIEMMSLVEEPDLISSNILLAAETRAGEHGEALRQFQQMVAIYGSPDKFTVVSFLNLCKNQADLRLGALCHGQMLKAGMVSFDAFALNALLAMYGRGGSVESCRKVFDEMPERNLVSWTAMVAALGANGRAAEGMDLLRRMEEEEGFVLDRVAFLAGISVCRHGGLVREGMGLLKRMEEEEGAPSPGEEHYAGVVELLCKAGMMEEAEQIIGSMPFSPGPAIWRVFLRGSG